jgi:hypothetical protein
MTQTQTDPMYVYFEACGWESEPFQAASDAAAEAHVMASFRSPTDVDFDGDEGGIVRLGEPEFPGDNGRRLVVDLPGENMVADPFNERKSYRGGC